MRFYPALCFLLPALLCVACSYEPKEKDLGRDSVKVQVPFSVDGKYILQVIELFSLRNLQNLEGGAAKFLIDPNGSRGNLSGRRPEIRFIRDADGVIIAKDNLSLQLLTVYTHMEKLQRLDKDSGIENLLTYPRVVAVNAQYRESGRKLENNAMYSAKYDALLIVPFTEQTLPLMANAGVIAHEHFHSIFQKLVIDPLGANYPGSSTPTLHDERPMLSGLDLKADEATNRGNVPGRGENLSVEDIRAKYHQVLFRGINEGLADVWGWVYSGDREFVGRSLPQEKLNRQLIEFKWELFSAEVILSAVRNDWAEDSLLSMSYEHGNQLARTLVTFADRYAEEMKISEAEVRPLMARFLIQLLPEIRKKYEGLKKDEYLNLTQVVQIFSEQVPNITPQSCEYLLKRIPSMQERKDTGLLKRCQDLRKGQDS